MTNPGFSAAATLDRRPPLLRNPRLEVRWADGEDGIVPQALPSQCHGQGYSTAKCYGVVNVCTDCCQEYKYGAGVGEVCGTPYVCGACFGLPF